MPLGVSGFQLLYVYSNKSTASHARDTDKNDVTPDNEDAVGEAIRLSGIPRQDIFVTTKLA